MYANVFESPPDNVFIHIIGGTIGELVVEGITPRPLNVHPQISL